MKNILTILTLVCLFAFTANAQSRADHFAIAESYVQANPNDTQAATLLEADVWNATFHSYFKTVSQQYKAMALLRSQQMSHRKKANHKHALDTKKTIGN